MPQDGAISQGNDQMANSPTIKQLISRTRGVEASEYFESFFLSSPDALDQAAGDILSKAPSSFNSCAMLSAMWVAYLKENYAIPAVVVVGDLKVSGKMIFKCKKNLPEPTESNMLISSNWDGHCWIEIDGWIGDLSVLITAYNMQEGGHLKDFVQSHFGINKGALISHKDDLPTGMKYIPKFVLKDSQVDNLVSGFLQIIQHRR